MAMRYSIVNYINENVGIYSSSEDSLYTLENLYNRRPSKPFRFEGKGDTSGAIPEWICVNFPAPAQPTFVGIFNHNIEILLSGDMLMLQACSGACPGLSGACDWDTPGVPDFELDLSASLIDYVSDSCRCFNSGAAYENWRLAVIAAGIDDPYIEIGELFLGNWYRLNNARLQPGRDDGPIFWEGTNITEYGQIWSNYYSEAEGFSVVIKQTNAVDELGEFRIFLSAVKQNDGKFVFIPDERLPFCYYVYLENMQDLGHQLVKGAYDAAYEWQLRLRTLVKGISLLG
jgi:hypothetical protein